MNSRGRTARTARTSPDYEAMLTNVKPHILEKILNIFWLDFSLFGYDMTPFLNILQNKYREVNVTNTI